MTHAPAARHFSILLLLFFTAVTPLPADTIFSPDGRIAVNCDLAIHPAPYPHGSCLYLNVQFNGITVIDDSPLGVAFFDKKSILSDLRIYSVLEDRHTEAFTDRFGRNSRISCTWNEALFFLQERNPPFRLLNLRIRVSNDGCAFRYEIPAQPEFDIAEIRSEETTFFLPADYLVYAQQAPDYHSGYELPYTRSLVSDISPDTLLTLPLLVNTGLDTWIAFSEAALNDYAGMYLKADFQMGHAMFNTDFSPLPGREGVSAIRNLPAATPWRVLLISGNPGRFAESDFILSLNEPSKIAETDWIRPGKCMWPWWTDNRTAESDPGGEITTAAALSCLRFAAEEEIEYLLLDRGWYRDPLSPEADITTAVPGLDLEAVRAEAAERQVGIFLWVHWAALAPRMEAVFSLFESWGIAGVKIDGMNRDDQEMVRFCRQALAAAADHHLMVDFHGMYKPTGIRRTWPNLITRDAVLGLEWCKRTDQCNPDHELLLPFIRMAAGPLDFGPGCFRTVMQDQFRPDMQPPVAMGTRAHQLAMYVIFDSPLQMLADYPAAYRTGKGIAFIASVPTVWDETRVLQGVPGEYILMLRRSGEQLYLAAMTDWTQRGVRLPLTFLGEGSYRAEMFSDGPNTMLNPVDVQYRTMTVDATATITIPMGPGGGYAACFTPLNKQ
ncbi:glycoside hydrolase family 97 protein [bacterium]|nr:glycoside hydrolase family 97 protein [bacterium]